MGYAHECWDCITEMPQKQKQTAARYRKGYEMLERYEGKLSCTVLRRGEAGNRLVLSLRQNRQKGSRMARINESHECQGCGVPSGNFATLFFGEHSGHDAGMA